MTADRSPLECVRRVRKVLSGRSADESPALLEAPAGHPVDCVCGLYHECVGAFDREPSLVEVFWGYEVSEAIAIIRRAEDAGLADRSKRLWEDKGNV